MRLFNKAMFQSIHFKIPMLFGLLFLVSFQIVGVLFSRQLESQMITSFEVQVDNQSKFLVTGASAILQESDDTVKKSKMLDLLQKTQGQDILNTQVINSDNEVVGVSNQIDQSSVGKRSEENDVHDVIVSGNPKKTRYVDPETNQNVLRVITPVMAQDRKILGAIVMDTNIQTVYTQLQNISSLFMNIMIIALIATISLAILIANKGIAKPVSEIKRKTELIADGEYDSEDATVYGNDELGLLAHSINELAIKIKEANATTESERQRLDSVLTHMSDGVIATDRRGNIVIVNEEALQLLDESRENVINASIMDVFKIRNKFTYRQLLETKDELIISNHSDNTKTIIKCEFSVVKRESGFISGIVCVLTNITEQEKIERERREFVSNVSHELRTPLTSMRSYTESLIDGAWQDDVLAPRFLNVIQAETDRMIRMVTELLMLSKIDAGRQKLSLELINTTQLLQQIVDRFNMLIQTEAYAAKKYEIVQDIDDQALWIEADQDKIIQVIDNIMNNAIKYSPDGGQITVRLVESGGNVVISVTDQGLGIPRQALPYIFNRFYRVDKARSRDQGGTGLGLAISKDVVTLHGGKIWATSVENQGSTFFISLPKYDDRFSDEEEW